MQEAAAAQAAEATANVTETAQPAISQSEQALTELLEKLGQANLHTAPAGFWETYQGSILHFGKLLVLAAIIAVLAYLLKKILQKVMKRTGSKLNEKNPALVTLFSKLVNYAITFITLMILLDLFGFNTNSILTVLGTCGLAIGLALKDSLANIAAGVVLLGMKAYKTGDYVDCSSVSGTIKEIGFFCTILTTVDGIEITVPNTAILGSPIKNYSKNQIRRFEIEFGISYGSSIDAAIKALMEMVRSDARILTDPAPTVYVKGLADSSVTLILRGWAKNEIFWNTYWDTLRKVKPAMDKANIEIPFPQRVITFANPLPVKQEGEKE